ncbi:MAG TPA: 4Fe-4S dicluster domain-containing protein [Thermoprotei archaeon]|nr:4Fe-4S dicluster domain-containing protein [Thermoprotei archaeon]
MYQEGLTLSVDPNKCIGCGACALKCPNDVIKIADEGFIRRITFNLRECDLCHGAPRCVSVCPEGAITLEEGTTSKDIIVIELEIVPCSECGRPTGITKKEALKIIKAVGGGSKNTVFLCKECKIKRGLRGGRRI